MSQFLTVKEALKLVSKSESTIKRLLREITSSADHEDRHLIQPSHADVEQRRQAGEPYIWKISSELLEKRYPKGDDESRKATTEQASTTRSVSNEIVAVLREQLQSKDRQIRTLENQLDKKDEQISNQHERMRETNVLMKDLQQRLSIAPARPHTSEVVDAAEPQQDEKGTVVNKKRSIWNRDINLFRFIK